MLDGYHLDIEGKQAMLATQQIGIQVGEGYNNFWVMNAETAQVDEETRA